VTRPIAKVQADLKAKCYSTFNRRTPRDCSRLVTRG